MDTPFFTNRRWYQQPEPTLSSFHPPSVRGVPVYHIDPAPADHQRAQRPPERTPAPKVVRIPVHFVGSEQLDRTGSAVKIQRVFRGFLVRKSLRKIKDIKFQVDEIEERLKRGEVVELVKKDAKERLRMNESLMALLLKLDSICGVDFGVRGCRKAVIRKAIGLQERIDTIVAADLDKEEEEKGEIVDVENEARVSSEAENSVPPVNLKNSCEADDREAFGGGSCGEGGERGMEVEGDEDEVGIVDVGVDCEVKVSGGCAENIDYDGREKEGNGAEESKTDRELLEKMMKENEKMMGMMSQLFERSETQTRMLNALTHRVELLEKAFVCDRLRRRKKKATPLPCTQN